MLKICPFAKSFKFHLHFKTKSCISPDLILIMWKNKMYPWMLIMLLSMVLKPHFISCCCQETVPLDASEQNRQLSDRKNSAEQTYLFISRLTLEDISSRQLVVQHWALLLTHTLSSSVVLHWVQTLLQHQICISLCVFLSSGS